MIQFFLKLALSLTFIVTATYVGKKVPSLGGLIATMPSTGLLVMIWLYADHSGDHSLMEEYSKGALLGIFPTVLFFLAAFLCFRKRLPFCFALAAGFASWLMGAFLHQWLTRFSRCERNQCGKKYQTVSVGRGLICPPARPAPRGRYWRASLAPRPSSMTGLQRTIPSSGACCTPSTNWPAGG